MRNTTMGDRLSAALKTNSMGLSTKQILNKETLERRARIQKSFRPRAVVTLVEAHLNQPAQEEVDAAIRSIESHVSPPIETPPQEESPQVTLSDSTQEQAPVEQPVNYSPDLAWLSKLTPFSPDINSMVGRLKDAQARIGFTLEQILAREKTQLTALEQAQHDYDAVHAQATEIRANLHNLEETISVCALLAEQCADIAPLLTVAHPVKAASAASVSSTTRKPYTRSTPMDPHVCRPADLLAHFEQNPGVNWSVKELVEAMPSCKQAHARRYASQALFTLQREKKIVRVQQGVYRYDKPPAVAVA